MPSTYTLISSNVLSSSAASVTFSAIPSTYTDLVLRVSARNDGATTTDNAKLEFNGDTSSANYSWNYLRGTGSAASASRTATGVIGYFQLNWFSNGAASVAADTFTNNELYIPSYTASQKKQFSWFNAQEDYAATANLWAYALLYHSTTAISSIKITGSSYNFVSGSSFYLYGIKNS
jgi:hypothetical protein